MVVEDTVLLSQSTVSRIIFQFYLLIKEIIKMPTTQERRNENHQLFRVLGYDNGTIYLFRIDSAIDCTHIYD